MKKIFIIMIIFSLLSNFIYSEDNQKSGYYSYLNTKIGEEITVNINTIDVSIAGTLVAVYDDGIIVQTYFDSVYIAKTSIAFIKFKLSNVKK